MDETSEAFMIAPALTSRLEWIASATDPRARANERLQAILAHTSSVDQSVDGVIGDEDQLLSISHALAHFEADAIVVGVNA